MKENTMNMTEGNPTRLILLFSIPMLVGNVFQQLYSFADSIIVGKLIGADALAAIGATGSISFFFFALSLGIGTGGGIVTSQFFGRGDVAKVKNCIVNNAYIMIVIPIVVGGAAFFLADPVISVMQIADPVIKANAILYLKINCVGMLFVSFYNYVSSMLRSLGDSRTPLYFLIFSCILNIGLDILFITVFHMGVFGAGVATVISQFLSGVLCMIFAVKTNSYFKFSKNDYNLNLPVIRDTVKIGMPVALQFSMIAISCMALQTVVNKCGPVAMAAFTATDKIEQFIHLPYQTLSAALSTFVGQNFGAKKMDRVMQGYRKSLIIMCIFTAIIIPVIQLCGGWLTSLFVQDKPDVVLLGGKALRVTSLFYFFLGIIYMVRGILYGVGDSLFSFINGIVEVIGRVSLPVLLVTALGGNVLGIWWSVGIVWTLAGITAWWRYVVIKKRLIN